MANGNAGRWLTFIFAIPLIAFVLYGQSGIAPSTTLNSKPLPNLHFKFDGDGKAGSLAPFKGKVLLVNFWASWCGPCMEEMPALRALDEKLRPKGFAVLAINVDEKRAVTLRKMKIDKMPKNLIWEPSETELNAFRLQSIPASFIVDRMGVIREGYLGAPDWNDPKSLSMIEKYLDPAKK